MKKYFFVLWAFLFCLLANVSYAQVALRSWATPSHVLLSQPVTWFIEVKSEQNETLPEIPDYSQTLLKQGVTLLETDFGKEETLYGQKIRTIKYTFSASTPLLVSLPSLTIGSARTNSLVVEFEGEKEKGVTSAALEQLADIRPLIEIPWWRRTFFLLVGGVIFSLFTFLLFFFLYKRWRRIKIEKNKLPSLSPEEKFLQILEKAQQEVQGKEITFTLLHVISDELKVFLAFLSGKECQYLTFEEIKIQLSTIVNSVEAKSFFTFFSLLDQGKFQKKLPAKEEFIIYLKELEKQVRASKKENQAEGEK